MKNTRMFQTFPDVVTAPELCKMLPIGRNTAYRLLNSGELQSHRQKIETVIRLSATFGLRRSEALGVEMERG